MFSIAGGQRSTSKNVSKTAQNEPKIPGNLHCAAHLSAAWSSFWARGRAILPTTTSLKKELFGSSRAPPRPSPLRNSPPPTGMSRSHPLTGTSTSRVGRCKLSGDEAARVGVRASILNPANEASALCERAYRPSTGRSGQDGLPHARAEIKGSTVTARGLQVRFL